MDLHDWNDMFNVDSLLLLGVMDMNGRGHLRAKSEQLPSASRSLRYKCNKH